MFSQAVKLIKEFEGFSSAAYPDPISSDGKPITIGYGTTRYRNGHSVKPGDVISESAADSYLRDEVDRIFTTLSKTIPQWKQLNQNQQSALLSFAYNLGANFYGTEGFDSITRMLRSGDFQDAARVFGLYTNNQTPGLVTRRKKEAELFCKPAQGMNTTMPTKILDFVEQPDGYTCQSAAIAKVIGSTNVGKIRSALLGMGEPGDPAVMGRYLTGKVASYKFVVDGSLNEAKDFIRQGCVIITHGWQTHSGHIVTLVGVEPDPNTMSYRFVVDDPFAEFDFKNNCFLNQSGNNVRYSSYAMYSYFVASQNNQDAVNIYKQGRLLSSERNMWMHVIKN